ncbi:MAG: hypothetical protein AAF191_05045 [Verrucomicrobiota bacterium]
MEAFVYTDLQRGKFSTELGGGDFAMPKLVEGTQAVFHIRTQANLNGEWQEVDKDYLTIEASISKVNEKPETGLVWIKADGVAATTGFGPNATATEVQTALLETGINVVSVTETTGEWTIETDEAVVLEVERNRLSPVSFVDFYGGEQSDGSFVYEMRMRQSPIAKNNVLRRVLPPPPEVYEVQRGDVTDGVLVPEIQAILIHPWFRGVYQLEFEGRRTDNLSWQDGPEEIKAALDAVISAVDESSGASFEVTNPKENTAYIEWSGSQTFSGYPHPLLGVHIIDAPEGDLQVTLDLSGNEVRQALRGKQEETFELEILATVRQDTAAEEGQETTDLHVICRREITVIPTLNVDSDVVAQGINYLDPPDPVNYTPFNLSQVLFGVRNHASALDAGLTHNIAHNLGTDEIAGCVVRENINGGRVLLPSEYTLHIDSENDVTLTLDASLAPVASEQYALVITTAGPEDHFLAHTHEILQINGLDQVLQDFSERITTLEDLAPIYGLKKREETLTSPIAHWNLPDKSLVFPTRKTPSLEGSLSEWDLSEVRPGGLLPAIHSGGSTLYTITIDGAIGGITEDNDYLTTPSKEYHGQLIKNLTNRTIFTGGGLGQKNHAVAPGDYLTVFYDEFLTGAAVWYALDRYEDPISTSFFPTQYNEDLFEIPVKASQLQLSRSLDLDFSFEVSLFNQNFARAQWVLVVEWANILEATAPQATDENLEEVDWQEATPILEERILISPVASAHRFKARIDRYLDSVDGDSIEATTWRYGAEELAPSSPSPGEDFYLRGRLIRFDCGPSDQPRGLIGLSGLKVAIGTGDPEETLGTAIIQ